MQLLAVDYQADNAQQLFVKSLKETGFGVLKNHPIQESLVAEMQQHWQRFFNSDHKQDFLYNKDTQDGFFPASTSETAEGASIKDIKEYYHYYPWGQCPSGLAEQAGNYYQQALNLAKELLTWVERHSPAATAAHYSMPLSQMLEGSQQTLLRILHYPPLDGSETPGAIRAAAHRDINLLTILPAANAPGLQVLGKDGNWIDVPCDFGNLIINIGDMLQEASGHYFPSTTHRVINPQGQERRKSRISLPLFLHARPDVQLSARYTADAYLNERLRILGVK